jgi:glycosyltransferase involved in cell wall biosynthesis
MKPKRVLVVVTGLGVGGAERQVILLARGLRSRGWQVRVVTLVSECALARELVESGVPVRSLGMLRGLPSIRGLTALASEYRTYEPSVVHAHMVHANLAARLARRLAPVPRLVCTAHNTREGGWVRDLWYRLTDGLADVTTNVSQAGMERYVRRGLVSPERARAVGNGVVFRDHSRSSEVRERLRKGLDLGHAFTWVCVARLTPVKGHFALLKAFALHLEACPASRLLLVGDGPLRDEIRSQIYRQGLGHAVQSLGNRGDVGEVLSAADAFVLASRMEGLPMAVLEALVAGLPVVATEVGGVGELLELSAASRLVPLGSPRALAEAMTAVAATPAAVRETAARMARSLLRQRYGLEEVLDTWEEIYAALEVRRPGLERHS